MKENLSLLTLFIEACKSGNTEKIAACLTLEVNIDCADQNGMTGLMICAGWDHCYAMEVLLNNQPTPNVNLKNYTNDTALHFACILKNHRAVTRLCSVPGVQLNAVNDDGWTPLLSAVTGGSVNVIKFLVQVPGVELNVKDKAGDSSVMAALKKRQDRHCEGDGGVCWC